MMAKKLPLIVAIGSLAVAVPAAARSHGSYPYVSPSHSSHHHHHHHSQSSQSCTLHTVPYRASGTFVSWTATKNSDGTYSGTITVDLRHFRHHGKDVTGTPHTYTLDHAKLTFGTGVGTPAAGDRVRISGKITEVARHCTDTSGTGVITVRRVRITIPHTPSM